MPFFLSDIYRQTRILYTHGLLWIWASLQKHFYDRQIPAKAGLMERRPTKIIRQIYICPQLNEFSYHSYSTLKTSLLKKCPTHVILMINICSRVDKSFYSSVPCIPHEEILKHRLRTNFSYFSPSQRGRHIPSAELQHLTLNVSWADRLFLWIWIVPVWFCAH